MPVVVFGAIALFVTGIIGLHSFYTRTPSTLRAHWGTAFLWTLVALVSFPSLLLENTTTQPIAWLIYSVSSCMMVYSWLQLSVRRRTYGGETRRSRYTPRRLFTQSVAGPISLLIFAMAISYLGSRLAGDAISQRDTVRLHLLSHYGFTPDALENSEYFDTALEQKDLSLLGSSLQAQNYCYLNPGLIVSQNSIALTALILQYHAADIDGLLVSAVEAENINQARYLLAHGANANAKSWTDSGYMSALQKAHQLHSQPLIHLLMSTGAKK